MELSRDISEFIECFVARDVRFLIVGGYALAAHGHPRYNESICSRASLASTSTRRGTTTFSALADEMGTTTMSIAPPEELRCSIDDRALAGAVGLLAVG